MTEHKPPPSGPPTGPQPGYGSQPPGYGGQPPGYGAPPPGYGSQPPGYGGQPPAYGGQPPAYGGQPPGYGAPPPGYAGQPPAQGWPATDPAAQSAGSGGPPDMLGPAGLAGPGGEPPSHHKRGIKVLLITAVLALIAGGGAFAFYQADPLHMFGEEPQAAEALPADALFYLGVDMNPSASQKVKALQFLNHFPAFRDEAKLDEDSDVRDRLFSEALAETDCPGVTYEDTMKPWLGDKFGMALMKPADGDSEPDVVVAVQVTDEDKASDNLSRLADCESDSAEFGFAFAGEYVLLAETDELADKFAGEAADGSLADDGEFQADMESLGELGVATLWVDVEDSIDIAAAEILGRGDDMDDRFGLLKDKYQRVAATFRFESDAAEIATTVFGDSAEISHGDNQIGTLPESSVLAMSQAGGSDRLEASWEDIKALAESEGVDFEAELAKFEAETGFSMPDDLETVLGDNIMFVADAEGLTPEALESEQFDALNAGIRFTGDAEAQKALYDEVSQLLMSEGGLPLTALEADDGFVMATNDSYAETLKELDGDLGSSAAFQSVIDDPEGKEAVFYFNWDLVEDQVIDSVADDPELADNLKPLRAVGVTAEVDGDYTRIITTVSVND